MLKFVTLIALYAAAVATVLLVEARSARTPEESGPRHVSGTADEQTRRVMFEVRQLLRDEVKSTLKNIDWRLSRMETLRKSMEDGLSTVQETAEDAARGNHGRLDAMQSEVRALAKTRATIVGLARTLERLEARLKAVEDRPAQVIREVVSGGAARGPGPVPPKDTGPKHPTLPEAAPRDPAVVSAEIAKARKGLASADLMILFPAIEKISEHSVVVEVPRLLEILAEFPDEFGRTAAAAALGKMRVADAVEALSEALVDKSGLVADQSSKSILLITGFDPQMPATARIRARRTIRNRVKEWWRAHEEEVRERLHQPRKTPAAAPK